MNGQGLQWQQVRIPLSGGVDGGTDPHVLPAGKLVAAENAVFTTRGAVAKKRGWSRVGTVDGDEPQLVHTHAQGLILACYGTATPGEDGIHQWAPATAAGNEEGSTRAIGSVPLMDVDAAPLSAGLVDAVGTSPAFYHWTAIVVGTLRLVACASAATGTRDIYLRLDDATTGATLYSTSWSGADTAPVLCDISATKALLAWGDNATGWLKYVVIDTAQAGASGKWVYDCVGSVNNHYGLQSTRAFDMCRRWSAGAPGSGAYLAYAAAGPRVSVLVFDGDGVAASPSSSPIIGDAASVIAIAARPSDDRVSLSWARNTAATKVLETCQSPTGAMAFGAVSTLESSATPIAYDQVTTVWDASSSTIARTYATRTDNAQRRWRDCYLLHGSLSDTGTAVAASVWLRRSRLASRGFTDGRRSYVCVTSTNEGNTGSETILEQRPVVVVTAGSSYSAARVVARWPTMGGAGVLWGSRRYALGAAQVIQATDGSAGSTWQVRLVGEYDLAAADGASPGRNPVEVVLGLGYRSRSSAANLGQLCYIATGGQVVVWDGARTWEACPHQYPENATAAGNTTGSGGMTAGASVSYRVYYEIVTRTGELIRSAYDEDITVTLGGANDSVLLTIPSLQLCTGDHQSVRIAVYRTRDNPTTTNPPFRLVSRTTANDPTVDDVVITDTLSDASLATRELDPYLGGVAQSVAPEPCRWVAASADRLWLAGFAGDPTAVRASQGARWGEAVGFPEEPEFRADVPLEAGGRVTALGVVGESVAVFSVRQIWALNALEVPSRNATGSVDVPRLVSSDTGALWHRSLVVFSGGLGFIGPRGPMALTPGLAVEWIGEDLGVVDTSGTPCLGAVALGTRHEIRWLVAGTHYIYQTDRRCWSTAPEDSGLLALAHVAGRLYGVAASSGKGAILAEATTYESSTGTRRSMAIETPWLTLSGVVSGYQSARCVRLLVRVGSRAKIRVRAWTDRTSYVDVSSTPSTSRTIEVGPGGSDVREVEIPVALAVRRCAQIKIRIDDEQTPAASYTASACSLRIQDLTLDVGVIPGAQRKALSAHA